MLPLTLVLLSAVENLGAILSMLLQTVTATILVWLALVFLAAVFKSNQ